jgi:hypothetical protein
MRKNETRYFIGLLSIYEILAVGFVKFSFNNSLCNVGFLKNLFLCFYNCCRLHGMFLKGVYKIESDTKSEYEGFKGTLFTFQNGYF